MENSPRTVIVGGLAAVGCAFLLGFVVGRGWFGATTFEKASAKDWTLIRAYRGSIDSVGGAVDARVYSAVIGGRELAGDLFLQNKIVVVDSLGPVEFTWPSDDEFAASQCVIDDLDGDGAKEFVFLAGEYAARVVSYRNRRFLFRQGQGVETDELTSAAKGLQLIDVNADGRREFLTLEAVVANPGAPVLEFRQEPRLKQWDIRRGFHDASPNLQEMYRRVLGARSGWR